MSLMRTRQHPSDAEEVEKENQSLCSKRKETIAYKVVPVIRLTHCKVPVEDDLKSPKKITRSSTKNEVAPARKLKAVPRKTKKLSAKPDEITSNGFDNKSPEKGRKNTRSSWSKKSPKFHFEGETSPTTRGKKAVALLVSLNRQVFVRLERDPEIESLVADLVKRDDKLAKRPTTVKPSLAKRLRKTTGNPLRQLVPRNRRKRNVNNTNKRIKSST